MSKMNRKQFFKIGLGLSAILVASKFLFAKKQVPVIKAYTSNEVLKTVKPDWRGTPLDQDGLFINHEFPWNPDYGQISKFMVERNPQREIKKQDTWRIAVLKNTEWLNDPSDKIVWLGHASFFIQLSGTRILIDPVYGKLPVGKRYSDLPVDPQLLLNIDYILVSHAHYDHCDKDSLQLLTANNPEAQLLTGLKLNEVIGKWTTNPIHTAGWYQQYNLNDGLQITFLPTRHWANRSLWDTNTSLWGSFMIQKGAKTIYYGGDSGHGSHYKDIGELFPSIDVALIGAGAYAPTWFMGPNHQDPYDATRAFNTIGGKVFIPFHYGTFDSAYEPMGEPEQLLTNLKSEGKINGDLRILKLGESLFFGEAFKS